MSTESVKTTSIKVRVGDSFITGYIDIPAKTQVLGTLYVAATGDKTNTDIITTNPYLVQCKITV
jgi:hypothetical protein